MPSRIVLEVLGALVAGLAALAVGRLTAPPVRSHGRTYILRAAEHGATGRRRYDSAIASAIVPGREHAIAIARSDCRSTSGDAWLARRNRSAGVCHRNQAGAASSGTVG